MHALEVRDGRHPAGNPNRRAHDARRAGPDLQAPDNPALDRAVRGANSGATGIRPGTEFPCSFPNTFGLSPAAAPSPR